MLLKDSARIFKCKYCGREYQMFERADGTLVTYPDKYPWPVHGEPELMSHIRSRHPDGYNYIQMWYSKLPEKLKYCYDVAS